MFNRFELNDVGFEIAGLTHYVITSDSILLKMLKGFFASMHDRYPLLLLIPYL